MENLPPSILNTFSIDFAHNHHTRADGTGLLNLPMVSSTSFGKKSVRYFSIKSWNYMQSLIPSNKFISISRNKLKDLLINHFISSY